MQIIFDSRFDGVADAHRMRDMLTAYITSRESVVTNFSVSTDKRTETQIAQQVARAVRHEEGPAVDPIVAAVIDPRGPASIAASFQPGDVSGSAPSPAGAAQLPIAPEGPADGVPMPPTVASVPAPPAVAPGAPAGPTTPAPSGDVDSAGLPWDKRIHSSSKAKNADGSWRKLRGLNDGALVARVEAELRAVAANPGNAALQADAAKLAGLGMDPMSGQPLSVPANGSISVTPAGAGATAIIITPPSGAPVPTPPQAAVIPPPPGTTVAPPVPAAPDVATPEGLMEWVTPRMMDGRLTFDTVAAALQANGVESLAALKTNPAAVPGVYAALGGT